MIELPEDICIAAKTAYGEARGEGRDGIIAVIWVILNRANKPGWWGKNVIEVCYSPLQFSCWNITDPNYKKLAFIDLTSRTFMYILGITLEVFSGTIPDITFGATNYHAEDVNPEWAAKMFKTIKIGKHIFYK